MTPIWKLPEQGLRSGTHSLSFLVPYRAFESWTTISQTGAPWRHCKWEFTVTSSDLSRHAPFNCMRGLAMASTSNPQGACHRRADTSDGCQVIPSLPLLRAGNSPRATSTLCTYNSELHMEILNMTLSGAYNVYGLKIKWLLHLTPLARPINLRQCPTLFLLNLDRMAI